MNFGTNLLIDRYSEYIVVEADEVGDAVDQHGGLSAACTREDEQRAVGGEHRLPLHIVQASELLSIYVSRKRRIVVRDLLPLFHLFFSIISGYIT